MKYLEIERNLYIKNAPQAHKGERNLFGITFGSTLIKFDMTGFFSNPFNLIYVHNWSIIGLFGAKSERNLHNKKI
ncbi:hypothetical protein [Peribacillus sp. NJ4]|uniref:hypothetical protein n=1 Tax=Peribacillus sp. NJ4 TaxID=3055862 RepID=UPI0025A2D204|nr:hypothetical protein [Peribacillus sp. NJ4]